MSPTLDGARRGARQMTGTRAAQLAAAGQLAAELAAMPLDDVTRTIERARLDLLELHVLRAEFARVRARERR